MAGRFTPKKSDAQRAADTAAKKVTGSAASAAEKVPSYAQSGRYTPPAPPVEAMKPTPVWVAPVMFTAFIIGVLMIVLNYMDVLLPGAPSNAWVLGGLALIVVGFMAATQLR
jgi:hypothetical protein